MDVGKLKCSHLGSRGNLVPQFSRWRADAFFRSFEFVLPFRFSPFQGSARMIGKPRGIGELRSNPFQAQPSMSVRRQSGGGVARPYQHRHPVVGLCLPIPSLPSWPILWPSGRIASSFPCYAVTWGDGAGPGPTTVSPAYGIQTLHVLLCSVPPAHQMKEMAGFMNIIPVLVSALQVRADNGRRPATGRTMTAL